MGYGNILPHALYPHPMPNSERRRFAIINGDDFGFSAGVNQAIIKAHEQGVLTSTSLMVTGDAAQEAIAWH